MWWRTGSSGSCAPLGSEEEEEGCARPSSELRAKTSKLYLFLTKASNKSIQHGGAVTVYAGATARKRRVCMFPLRLRVGESST